MDTTEGSFATGFYFDPSAGGASTSGTVGRVEQVLIGCKTRYPFDPSVLPTQDNEADWSADSSDEDEEDLEEQTESQIHFEESSVPPAATFAEMSLSAPLIKALAAMNFATPTAIQSIAVPVGLTGRDICGAAETGSGKTAAFLIPCVERLLHKTGRVPGCRVLVLLPTRELALQCHSVLQRLTRFCGKRVCSVPLVGGESLQEQRASLTKHKPDVVIATPGRLIDHLHNTASFSLDQVDVLILDEADRMLEAGFEDELQEIIKQCPKSRQTVLFSATMTDKVDALSRLSLNKPIRLFIDSPGQLARHLEQHFVRVRREQDRLAILLATVKEHVGRFDRMIVFVPTKEMCTKLAVQWRLAGLPECRELHGGLEQHRRNSNLDAFRRGEAAVLLATDVAARGLDIPQVTLVLNYSLPPNIAQYCHRVGRTARAGRSGRAVSLVGQHDRKLMRSIIKSTPPASTRPKQRRSHAPLVAWFSKFLVNSEQDVQKVLEAEREERELGKAERELKKAERFLGAQSSGAVTKKPEWFQKKSQKRPDLPQSRERGGNGPKRGASNGPQRGGSRSKSARPIKQKMKRN